MSILKLTSENFQKEVVDAKGTVLVDFYADWCGPCKMMSPVIDNIADEYSDKVKVGKINIDENQNLAVEYNVMSIPTIMIFKNGQLQHTVVGVRDKKEILDVL